MRASSLAVVLLFAGALPAPAVKITEYTIPTANSAPRGICVGPEGDLWFTEKAAGKIGVIDVHGNVTEEYVVPTMNSQPYGITRAADALYFTEYGTGKVSYVGLNGTFLESGADFSSPLGIAYGEDHRLYVAENSSSKVGISGSGGTPSLSLEASTMTGSAGPWGVAYSPWEYVYVAEFSANKLGECFTWPSTPYTCNEYTPLTAASGPIGVAVAPDGVVWVTEYLGNNILKYYFGITEYPIPTAVARPFGIVAGPDGNVWFTEENAGKIARITKAGVITEYPTPTADSGPAGITLGPDGNLWVCESLANKIAKIEVFVPGDVNGDGGIDVADVFYLINFLFAGGPPPG
jgi:virginiamycin B lyase